MQTNQHIMIGNMMYRLGTVSNSRDKNRVTPKTYYINVDRKMDGI